MKIFTIITVISVFLLIYLILYLNGIYFLVPYKRYRNKYKYFPLNGMEERVIYVESLFLEILKENDELLRFANIINLKEYTRNELSTTYSYKDKLWIKFELEKEDLTISSNVRKPKIYSLNLGEFATYHDFVGYLFEKFMNMFEERYLQNVRRKTLITNSYKTTIINSWDIYTELLAKY